MYTLIPIIMIIFSAIFGVYFLYIEPLPALGVYFFLLTLYFFLSLYEKRGDPFSKPIYYLLIVLLVANGVYFLFFYPAKYLISGIISLFFAFSAWSQVRRIG